MTDAELLAGNEPTLNGKKLSQIYAEQMAHRLAANCFDIFEAAKAIAVQLGYDISTEEELRDDMSQAAHEGTLTVRSPRGHDQYAPTRPPSTTYGFDCLVTPDDVNEWATKRRLSWRWRVQAPAQSPATPAPVETVEQRRARYLATFEAEEKRLKRGALQRVADSEGVDRSNMSKDIAKARSARDEQNRAGPAWASQLIQDGKRKG